MKDDILFYESQPSWRNRLLSITIILIALLFIWGFIQQVIFDITWGNNPMSDWGLSIITVLLLLSSIYFLFIKMETFITKDGIFVKYFPLLLKTKFFSWDDIQEVYVRKYNPVYEYGGWGVKYYSSRNKAYNVYGNTGLQIVFKNGKKLLIGTNQAEELNKVLKKLDDKRK